MNRGRDPLFPFPTESLKEEIQMKNPHSLEKPAATLIAAATLLAAALLSGTPLAGYGPVNGLTALGMAVCCTLLGHNVFSWGLKYLPPAFIATVKLIEPVFASVLGLLLFGERPGWLTVAGGAAVLLGVGLYARTIGGDAGKREEREP